MKLSLSIAIAFFCLPLGAQEIPFRFTGLKRTSASVLKKRIRAEEFHGKPFTGKEVEQVKNRLSSLGLFSDINIAPDGNGRTVISLKEKWTLLPMPVFSTSGNQTKFGLFLIERNFFGLLKDFYAGGMFGKDGSTIMGGFIDPSLLGSDFTWKTFFRFTRETFRNSDSAGTVYRIYDADEISFKLAFGYKITPSWSVFLFGNYHSVDVASGSPLSPPESAARMYSGLETGLKKLNISGWTKSGIRLRASLAAGLPVSGEPGISILAELNTALHFRPAESNQLSLKIKAGANSGPAVLGKRIGGQPGFFTLPDETITARNYGSTTLSWEFSAIRFPWATITLVAFYEGGIYETEQNEWQSFTGPGLGFRFYLKNIALPAMGLNTSWNLETSEIYVNFSIGMQM